MDRCFIHIFTVLKNFVTNIKHYCFFQVVSIDLRSNLAEGKGVFIPEGHQVKSGITDEIAYVGILNKVLPPEIRVIAWAPVKESFSARFDCKQRTYHYYFPKASLNIEVRTF